MNENIIEVKKNNMFVIEEHEICDEKLFEIFSEFPQKTIYVCSKKKLIGIITLGDFKRYLLFNDKLLNNKFTVVLEDDVEIIKNIFCEKQKIISIPVINKLGQIQKEYCKEVISDKKNYLNMVEQIYQEAALDRYDKCFFVVKNLLEETDKQVAEKIYETTNGKIVVCTKVSLEEIKKSNEKIYIYDMRKDVADMCNLVYSKYHIDNTCYRKDREEMLEHILEISDFYSEIGIFDKNVLLKNKFATKSGVTSIDSSKLKWNKQYECYEYFGTDIKNIEVILAISTISRNSFIKKDDYFIPIISIFGNNSFDNALLPVCDEDIAFNIIPYLNQNNVKCIVIANALVEFKNLEESVKKKIVKKDLSCRTHSTLLDRELGGTEHELFWQTEKGDYNEELVAAQSGWYNLFDSGILQFGNIHNQYINYENGERYTCNNPSNYKNTIYLFGPCIVMGRYAEDEYTLGSILRKYISDKYYIKNCGSVWESMSYIMRKQKYSQGDIVVCFAENDLPYKLNNIKLHSIMDVYKNIPNLENNIWEILYHCNGYVNKFLAKKLHNIISRETQSYELEGDNKEIVSFGKEKSYRVIPKEMEEWLHEVEKYKINDDRMAGAIVMNCNPFTKGHRYLIEEARKKVDLLYVFVVEEDKSFFEFKDRFEMVKIGVADLENVIVIPSGKYIISTETLPGYFDKERKPNAEFDATEDLEIFANVIAKAFNIKIRFAGEEPIDIFTNRYNEFMSRILPEYGVKFCEIPRKELKGEVISASRVRKCMKEKNYDEVKNLVLPCIYQYLELHYFD